MSHWHKDQFQTHISHLVSSMGPIVSAVTLQVGSIQSRKADQLAKPGKGTVQ